MGVSFLLGRGAEIAYLRAALVAERRTVIVFRTAFVAVHVVTFSRLYRQLIRLERFSNSSNCRSLIIPSAQQRCAKG